MIEHSVFARSFGAVVVVTAIGLLWPLRYIWLFPLAIVALGIAAVML